MRPMAARGWANVGDGIKAGDGESNAEPARGENKPAAGIPFTPRSMSAGAPWPWLAALVLILITIIIIIWRKVLRVWRGNN